MSFEIAGKVALVTGGASGIGLCVTKELLGNNAKGITIADVNEELGRKVVEELAQEFGPNRAIFVKTDVSNKDQFKNAFEKTIETFKNIDILVNNAGISNEFIFEKVIAINLYGTVYGTVLALEDYIPKYKSGNEGLIVNVSSVAGVLGHPGAPVYAASKFGVVGLTRSYGYKGHYEEYKVRIVAVCPGFTETPHFTNNPDRIQRFPKVFPIPNSVIPMQRPEHVAKGLIKVAKEGQTGSVWVIANSEEPLEIKGATLEDIKKK